MTEKNIFRSALITLGSTIALPLVVAATGIAAPNVSSTNDLVKDYIAAAHGTDAVQSNNSNSGSSTETKSDTNKSSTSSNNSTDQAQSSDTTSTTTPTATDTQAMTTASAKVAGTYTVKAGDTYGCIAENYYGSYEQWPKVYAANSMYPGYEEYYLNVGAAVQLPAISASEVLPQTSLCR